MRNPENIDLKQYPPPPGYVVADWIDFEAANGFTPIEWLFFFRAGSRWARSYGPNYNGPLREDLRRDWTYVRPITPEDQQGDKYDTDHMFPG